MALANIIFSLQKVTRLKIKDWISSKNSQNYLPTWKPWIMPWYEALARLMTIRDLLELLIYLMNCTSHEAFHFSLSEILILRNFYPQEFSGQPLNWSFPMLLVRG